MLYFSFKFAPLKSQIDNQYLNSTFDAHYQRASI